jgi:hypothetical protein
MRSVSATELRGSIYRILDGVIETREPVRVTRRQHEVLIVPVPARRRSLDDAPRRTAISCSPDELVDTRWEEQWTGRQ